jgi:hypothetical protein
VPLRSRRITSRRTGEASRAPPLPADHNPPRCWTRTVVHTPALYGNPTPGSILITWTWLRPDGRPLLSRTTTPADAPSDDESRSKAYQQANAQRWCEGMGSGSKCCCARFKNNPRAIPHDPLYRAGSRLSRPQFWPNFGNLRLLQSRRRDDAFQKALWSSHGFKSSAGICSWQPAAGNASPLPCQQTMQQPCLAIARICARPPSFLCDTGSSGARCNP